jgi:hypothetical protein
MSRAALSRRVLLLTALSCAFLAHAAVAQDVAATCARIAGVLGGTGNAGGLEQQADRVHGDIEDLQRLENSAQHLVRDVSSQSSRPPLVPARAPEAKVYQDLRAFDRAAAQARLVDLAWYRSEIQGLEGRQSALDAALLALHRRADALRCNTGTNTAASSAPARSFAGFWTTADGYVIQLVRLGSYVVGSIRVQNDVTGIVGLLAGRFDGNVLHLVYTAPQGNPLGTFDLGFSQDGNQLVGRWDPPTATQSPLQIWWQRAGR